MANKGSWLSAGAYLSVNDYLVSDNKGFYAILKEDGNFVLYNGSDPSIYLGEALWASKTAQEQGQYFAILQDDGNFVIYEGSDPVHQGARLWSIVGVSKGSWLSVGEYLSVGDYLVSDNKKYFAIMQSDGNFVLYYGNGPSQQGPANIQGSAYLDVGQSRGQGQYFAIMQSDGNFVLYYGSDPSQQGPALWASDTMQEQGQYFAIMQNDGSFAIYEGSDPAHQGAFRWHTGPNLAYRLNLVVFNAINKSRTSAGLGLSALKWNNAVARAAQWHNFVMAAANAVSHQLPGEPNAAERNVQQLGITEGFSVMENCNHTYSLTDDPVGQALAMHEQMMGEQPPNDGHRQNILNPYRTEGGVVLLFDHQHNTLWLTEDLLSL